MQGRSQAACLCSVLWLSSHSLSPREAFLAKSCFLEPVPLCQGLWVRGGDALLRCSSWPCLLPDDTSLPLVGTGSWQRTENSEATSLLPIFPSSWAPTMMTRFSLHLGRWVASSDFHPTHPLRGRGLLLHLLSTQLLAFPVLGGHFTFLFSEAFFSFSSKELKKFAFVSSVAEQLDHHS